METQTDYKNTNLNFSLQLSVNIFEQFAGAVKKWASGTHFFKVQSKPSF